MADFDPYHRWLQIPANEQPANHYRLLGLVLYESDPDVIENAANQRLAHLRTFQSGPNGPISQKIMNEVTQAKLALLVPENKAAYDAQLQAAIAAKEAADAVAANPFTQLNTPGSASATASNPGAPNVVNRTLRKKSPGWILPVAIVGTLLLLLAVGGVIAAVVMNGGADPVAVDHSKDPAAKSETKATEKKQETTGAETGTESTSSGASNKQSDASSNTEQIEENTHEQTQNDPSTETTSSDLSLSNVDGIDLLKTVNPEKHILSGDVRVDSDGSIYIAGHPNMRRVVFPVVLPVEYDLHGVIESGERFGFCLMVNGQRTWMTFDQPVDNEKRTGLAMIGGKYIGEKDFPKDALWSGEIFANGPVRFRLNVLKNSVTLYRVSGENEEKLYQWTGDATELAGNLTYYEAGEPFLNCLSFMQNRGELSTTIQELKLVPLSTSNRSTQWHELASVESADEEQGEAIDLLPKINPMLVNAGEVSVDADGVSFKQIGNKHGAVAVEYDLPENYDIEARLVVEGDGAFSLFPVIGGRQVKLDFDSYSHVGKRTALAEFAGKNAAASNHVGHVRGVFLPKGKEAELICKVRSNGLRLFIDGEEIYRWFGSCENLKVRTRFLVDTNKNFLQLGTYNSRVRFKKLNLVPVTVEQTSTSSEIYAKLNGVLIDTPTTGSEVAQLEIPDEKNLAEGKPIDLFRLLKYPDNLRSGLAKFPIMKAKKGTSARSLIMGSTRAINLVDFPILLPREYDIRAKVADPPSGQSLAFTFHLDGNPASLLIDAFPEEGSLTGMAEVNGAGLSEQPKNSLAVGQLLIPGSTHELELNVRARSVALSVDQKRVFHWIGDPTTLSLRSYRPVAPELAYNFAVSSFKSPAAINDLQLVPRGAAAEDSDWLEKSMHGVFVEKPGKPVNLLGKLKPELILRQPVKVDGTGVLLEGSASLEFDYDLPENYDIALTATNKGRWATFLNFPMNGARAQFGMNMGAGSDGKGNSHLTFNRGTTAGDFRGNDRILPRGKSASLLLQVRQNGMRVVQGGVNFYQWFGDAAMLRRGPDGDHSALDSKRLSITASSTDILIESLQVRPVEVQDFLSADEVLAKLKQVNPTIGTRVPQIDDVLEKSQPSFDRPDEKETTPDEKTDEKMAEKTTEETPAEVENVKLREFSNEEKAELVVINKAIRAVQTALDKQDYDAASIVIANASTMATFDETKKMVAALTMIKKDTIAFWDTVEKQCGTLQPAHEIELTNGIALVVESSEERIVLRYNGRPIRKAPRELPSAIAMKLLDSVITEPSADQLRVKGAIYFIDSVTNKENREKAGSLWSEAKAKESDVGPLMILLAK